MGLGLGGVSSGSRVGSFYLLWAPLLAPALPGCALWPSLSEKRLGLLSPWFVREGPVPACHLHPPSSVLKAGRHCTLLAFLVLLFQFPFPDFIVFEAFSQAMSFQKSEKWKVTAFSVVEFSSREVQYSAGRVAGVRSEVTALKAPKLFCPVTLRRVWS